MTELLHTVSHFTTCLMLVYCFLLWIRNNKDFSQKVLAVTMFVRNVLAWMMILYGYGKIDLSYNLLEPGMIVSGFFMTTTFFFYPFAAIYPGRFNWKNVLLVFLPFVLLIGIMKALDIGGMGFRELHNFREIWLYIQEPNVWTRLLLATCCHLYPLWSIIITLRTASHDHPKREVLRIYGYGTIGMMVVFSTMMVFSAKAGIIMQQVWVNVFFTVITYKLVFAEQITQRKKLAYKRMGNGRKEEEASLFVQLEKVMQEQQPYINPELTLPELAVLIGTNRTSLSKAIREQGFKSFQDYLNRYRIEELKRQLKEGDLLSLGELYVQVGFGSKSTFFRCFREYEGITPMEYIRQMIPHNP